MAFSKSSYPAGTMAVEGQPSSRGRSTSGDVNVMRTVSGSTAAMSDTSLSQARIALSLASPRWRLSE